MTIEFTQEEIEELTTRCCRLGESMGLTPHKFSIMLTMVAKFLTESQGIEVTSERKLDS